MRTINTKNEREGRCMCDNECGNCSCETRESMTEVLARLMFDSNITVEDFSKKSKIPVKHIKAILSQEKDNLDTGCLFNLFMTSYKVVYAKMV